MTSQDVTRAALAAFAEETVRPSHERAWRMLDAGRLTVTIRAVARDRHASFRITPRHDSRNIRNPNLYWCSTADGRYVATMETTSLVDGPQSITLRFTYKSVEDKATRYAAQLVERWLNGDDLSDVQGRAYVVSIASRCGRCGRELTTPESIALGLGPECERVRSGTSAARRSRPA